MSDASTRQPFRASAGGFGRLPRNILSGVMGQVCGLAVAFVTTPILLHGLGKANYGLWNVGAAVGTWVGFINMMFSTSAIRFVGEAMGRGASSRAQQAHQALRRWSLVCGTVGALILILLAPWLAHYALTVEVAQRDVAVTVLLTQAVFVLFQILTAVESGVLVAHQRLDLSNLIRASGQALQSGGAAVVVSAGHGLVAVVWWVAAMQGMEWLAAAWWAHRLQPAVAGFGRVNMKEWGLQLLRYGSPLMTGYTAAQLFLPTSRILLGMLRPVAEVAYFAVPLTLAINVKALSTHIASAVFPALAEKAGKKDRDGLQRLYLHGLRWSWLAVVPPAGMVIVLGGAFINAWIGPEFGAQVAPLIPILVIAVKIYYFSSMPEIVSQGIGQPGSWAAIIVGSGLLNVVLGRWWIPHHGVLGAAAALLISSVVLTGGLFIWAGYTLRLGLAQYLSAFDPRVLLATSVIGGLLAWLTAGRTLTMGAVIGWGVAGGLAILALMPWWLPTEERAWIGRQWRAIGRSG